MSRNLFDCIDTFITYKIIYVFWINHITPHLIKISNFCYRYNNTDTYCNSRNKKPIHHISNILLYGYSGKCDSNSK